MAQDLPAAAELSCFHAGCNAIIEATNGRAPVLDPGKGDSIEAWLVRLRSGDAALVWREFLSDYSPLLLGVARRYSGDVDLQSELFLHVCEELSNDRFARLQKFDPNGRARFTTWLHVVATNLCIDWVRKRKGRERPFANVARLPSLEQALFHLRFERKLDRRACYAALQSEFVDLTEARFRTALGNLERVLTPDQRWRVNARGRPLAPLEHAAEATNGESAEDGAAAVEAEERLAEALDALDPRDRLILAYRFEQDLTFEQIARLMSLGDAFRARRQVQAAIDHLSTAFGNLRKE